MRSPETLTKKKSRDINNSNFILPKQTVAPQRYLRYSPSPKTSQQNKWLETSNNFAEENSPLKRDKSYNILHYLDQRDKKTYSYRNFSNLSKISDLKETIDIIVELLDKHAEIGSLSTSEQYILTGYFAKYIEFTQKQHTVKDPFDIALRIETKNAVVSEAIKDKRNSSPKTKNKGKKRIINGAQNNEKKQQLSKAFLRLKFLWQIYQLKCLVCPFLCRSSEHEQSETHRQMIDMIEKLKEIQKNRAKIGEEKTCCEVGKIMKRFEAKIKYFLC